jgi:predicted Zn-dependent peptidase
LQHLHITLTQRSELIQLANSFLRNFVVTNSHHLVDHDASWTFRLPDTQPKSKNVSQPSVTRLENGVTVVSESSSMVSTITMTYPKAGSNNESVEEFGASIANRFMSYKSASGLSSFLIFKTFQRSAAIPSFSGGRTSTTLGYTTCREKALDLIPLLATNAAFEDWDVRDALKDVAKEITIAHDATHVRTFLLQ